MTENLPAVVHATPERAVVRADTDSWIEVVGEVAKFAGYIAGTEFVPKSLRDSPAATTAAIMYGREVGLGPMAALTQTHVIEGRPAISAEAQRALVLSQGHDIQVVESTGAICRMRARRRGTEEWSAEVVWSIDMARAAGLLNKNNWKNYPRRMLQARASGELCSLHFPDVVLGFTSLEEMNDAGAEEQAALESSIPQGSTPVKRAAKKVAAKRAPAALPAAPAERPEPTAGPPLPGEAGYDTESSTDQASGESDESPAPSHEAGDGPTEGTPAADTGTVDDGADAPPDTSAGPDDGGEAPSGPVERDVAAPPRAVSRAQIRMINARLGELGVDTSDREERLTILGAMTNRALTSSNDLTMRDAKHVIDTLAVVNDKADLNAMLDALDGQADQ